MSHVSQSTPAPQRSPRAVEVARGRRGGAAAGEVVKVVEGVHAADAVVRRDGDDAGGLGGDGRRGAADPAAAEGAVDVVGRRGHPVGRGRVGRGVVVAQVGALGRGEAVVERVAVVVAVVHLEADTKVQIQLNM